MDKIIKIEEIITDNTKVIDLNENQSLRLGYSARASFSKKLDSTVFYKPFSLEEYIGEYIAKYMDLKTIENFIVRKEGKLFIASKSFIDKEKEYKNAKEIDSMQFLYKFENFVDIIKKYKNKDELIIDFFKMVSLDIYMRQEDRNMENYMFEIKNNFISLAPLYDYTIAFDYYANEFPYFYYNGILRIHNPEDYKLLYNEYKSFREGLLKVQKLNLITILEEIFENNNFRLNDQIIENYKKEEEKTQKLLQKIL